jgi:predicted acylesterase/phospholipase RssA
LHRAAMAGRRATSGGVERIAPGSGEGGNGANEAPEAPAFWWEAFPSEQRWHGVFQGGGAKGVAYGGALAAMKARERWFCSVAGSSAGALTAALVAAGFAPWELVLMTSDLLKATKPKNPLDWALSASRVARPLVRYNSEGLVRELEGRLRVGLRRHGGQVSGDVTFKQLTTATGIELYVLALDATLGRPVPFCAERTPDIFISAAVAASCSIPLAFPPRYIETAWRGGKFSDSLPMLRRLVDGGAWANFPIFIYQDGAFRKFFELNELPPDRKVVGFVLGTDIHYFAARPRRFIDPGSPILQYSLKSFLHPLKDKSPLDADPNEKRTKKSKWGSVLTKNFLASLAMRYLVVIWVGLWLGLGVLLIFETIDKFETGPWWKAVLYAIGLSIFWSVSLIGGLIGWRLFEALRNEGLDTLRSLIGQATSPPLWAGLTTPTDSEKVAIVRVPISGIDTTDFDLPTETVAFAVERARQFGGEQLDQMEEWETWFHNERERWRKAFEARPDRLPYSATPTADGTPVVRMYTSGLDFD